LIEIVSATAKMVRDFYGEPQDKTIKAIAVVEGSEILGLGGYYLLPSCLVVFSEIKPKYLNSSIRNKILIMRSIRKVMEMAKKTNLPMYAAPAPEIEGAPTLLAYLGFVEQRPGIYLWLQ